MDQSTDHHPDSRSTQRSSSDRRIPTYDEHQAVLRGGGRSEGHSIKAELEAAVQPLARFLAALGPRYRGM